MKKIIAILGILMIYISIGGSFNAYGGTKDTDTKKIDALVMKTLISSKVPNASIVIVDKSKNEFFNYNNPNINSNIRTTNSSLFELGSMSKAYTALGILYLEYQKLLSLEDPITKYIPDLTFKYKGDYDGKNVNITVEPKISNFLYHTRPAMKSQG